MYHSPADECKLVSVKSFVYPQATQCLTRFCYFVENYTLDTVISLNLFGVNYEGGNFKTPDIYDYQWKMNSYGGLSVTFNQGNNTMANYCFDLTGQYSMVPSKMFLNMGLYTCEKDVDVPGIRRDCAVDCVLDTNFANAQCQSCGAVCPLASNVPSVTDVQTCTLKVLTTPNYLGKTCQPTVTRTCTNTCPVNCATSGPLWEECKANCDTPTVQQLGFYSTVVPPLNGGSPWSVDIFLLLPF
ncbi:hypothetical protein HMI56_006465 [Coelomomyces lativittatus]|nr:hypothetical protein HMI56_006465 [Coelomomyces lativittatus]